MRNTIRRYSAVLAIAALLERAFTTGSYAAAPTQRSFASPEEAAATLAQAARSDDHRALLGIFGSGSGKLLFSGDPVADAAQLRRFADAYAAKRSFISNTPNKVDLEVGADGWLLPIPIVHTDGRWRFDTKAGAEEIVNRRIGRDELSAIQMLLAFVEAEKDYFQRRVQQTGTGMFAERLISTPGHQDGLYWPVPAGKPESPFGSLVEQAREEGYPGDADAGKPIPYKGYYYRILQAQGPNAPGGTKMYVQAGGMSGGYALLAWPAKYGASGIMSFQVGPEGVVFQKDLGLHTAAVVGSIQQFDPDLSWARVMPTAQ